MSGAALREPRGKTSPAPENKSMLAETTRSWEGWNRLFLKADTASHRAVHSIYGFGLTTPVLLLVGDVKSRFSAKILGVFGPALFPLSARDWWI